MPATYTVPKTMAHEPTIYPDWNTYLRDNILYLKSKTDIAPQILLNDTGVHQISNTVTETDANTYTIPGNTIGATGMITFEAIGYCTNTSGGNDQYDLKVYWNGVALSTPMTKNLGNGETYHMWYKFVLKNTATNAQVWWIWGRNGTASAVEVMAHGTATVDTTANVIIKNTHKWGTANANAISNIYWGRVEYAPAI